MPCRWCFTHTQMHRQMLTWTHDEGSVGVARCRLACKKWIFFYLKWSAISLLKYRYHYPHCFLQLYWMLISHLYVKLNFRANFAGHLSRYLNLGGQCWPLKFKWLLSRLAHLNGVGAMRFFNCLLSTELSGN